MNTVTAEYQRCYILSIWFLQLIYLCAACGIIGWQFLMKEWCRQGQ